MHINDLIEFMADHGCILKCSRGNSGEIVITLKFQDSVESVGSDLDSMIDGFKDGVLEAIKNRNLVPLKKQEVNRLCRVK